MQYLISKLADIEKFVTNRDFWLKGVFPFVLAFGIVPYINEENAEAMSDQAVALVQLIFPIIGMFLLAISKSNTTKEFENFIAELKKILDK